jgi:acetoin utilization protein AcuB
MMHIKDCMKKKVVSIQETATISQAAALIVEKHIGTLPVVDAKGKPVGVLRLRDLLRLEMPDFVDLIADVDFVHDFGAVETTHPTHSQLARPVTAIMQPIITIDEKCGLLRAHAMMLKNELYDLPVTNADGELSGIVSRVDLTVAVLSNWPGE